jgi:two-component system LytT family response regulator
MDLSQPPRRYRQRFVVRRGAEFVAIAAADCAYFQSDDKLTFLVTRDGQRFLVDATLAALEAELDPEGFLRLNRQVLASAAAVASFRCAGKGKLLVELTPRPRAEVLVSQERASRFRAWLSR